MLWKYKKYPEGKVTTELLSLPSALAVLVLCFFDSLALLGGIIFYYGWKDRMPKMAVQAFKISLLAILLQFFVIGYLFSH
jgi:hypothetical protein